MPVDKRRRSLVFANLNYEAERFLWHEYPALLQRLGLNNWIAGALVADAVLSMPAWRPYY